MPETSQVRQLGLEALNLQQRHLTELPGLVGLYIPGQQVWAYGSRVNGTAHEASDLDLVVVHPADPLAPQGPALRRFREALRESNIPFTVDIHDWATLPESFRVGILAAHVVLASQMETPKSSRPA